MAILQIIYGYNPIFKKKAEKFSEINQDAKDIAELMLNTMYHERAVGIGANMVGILKRIIVIDLLENGEKNPIVAFNPEIIEKSTEMQSFEEASISFPGIITVISRPNKIKLKYQDLEGNEKLIDAEGFLASVIQHEIDYLDGITIFDHVSKLRKDTLLKKMEKHLKMYPPHIHSASCSH